MSYLDLEELAKELDDLRERKDDEEQEWPLDEGDQERLHELEELEGQLFTDMADHASHEATMIPEEEFEDYAQELAESVGYTQRSEDNPLQMYIDWERWANETSRRTTPRSSLMARRTYSERIREGGQGMRTPICQCTDSGCPQTVADTGQHPSGPKCDQPAVGHLFFVPREAEPLDFCEPCGDDAMQSGLFASGEDVAAARREGNGGHKNGR